MLSISQKVCATTEIYAKPSPNIFIDPDVDMSKDEDFEIVKTNLDAEVCIGKIGEATVNAHKIPTPKMVAFQGTQKQWPTMKVELLRQPGGNSIIRVLDPTGKDFGTIDQRTASVLALLMDSVKTSKMRWTTRLDNRDRKPWETPNQQVSASYKITIVLYAPRKMVTGVGKLFTQRQVILRDPVYIDRGVPLVNPHAPKDYTPKAKAMIATTSRYASSGGVYRSNEEVKQDVFKLFDTLEKTDDLPPMEPVQIIKTPLLMHQMQALYFMTRRETDTRDDPNAEDEGSLWKEHIEKTGKKSWYHVISGHKIFAKPEPVLGGILADVMGLGKTLNVLSVVAGSLDAARAFAKEKPPKAVFDDDAQDLRYNSRATLLICPLSTVANWEEQIKAHIRKNAIKSIVYHGTNRTNNSDDLKDYDIVITTYSVVAADADSRSQFRKYNPLAEVNWFRIVLDEAHIIREQSTNQSKTVCALAGSRRWAVTGTPVQNRLEDLGALFKFLRIKPFDEPRNFAQYILSPFKSADPEVLPHLRILVDSITIRRLKDKIDLPERVERHVFLDMTSGERDTYMFYARDSTKKLDAMAGGKKGKVPGVGFASVLRAISRCRLLCAHGQDLLSDADWDAVKGVSVNNAIDLESEDDNRPEKTARQAYEMLDMMRDANVASCARCSRYIKAEDITDEEAEEERADAGMERTKEVIGYLAPCNQLICTRCIRDFRRDLQATAGSDSYAFCPHCESYMRTVLYELKQSEYNRDQETQRQIRANPRLVGKSGRYSGPHSKALALMERLSKNADESTVMHGDRIKSVVFSGWTSNLDLIQIALNNARMKFTRLDGSMTRSARAQVLRDFAEDPDIHCILVSISAGGLGLNLTAASRVYVMEPQFNPAAEDQAIERVHRLGQKREVLIEKFIMNDSIEVGMMKVQERKKNMAKMSMDKDDMMTRPDKIEAAKRRMEELRSLFR